MEPFAHSTMYSTQTHILIFEPALEIGFFGGVKYSRLEEIIARITV